jgi:hypothetical protein
MKALYLFLVPPLFLLGLLVYALFRPLELRFGPVIVLAATVPALGGPPGAVQKPLPKGQTINGVDGREYRVTGSGTATAFTAGDRFFAVAWFQGHRK